MYLIFVGFCLLLFSWGIKHSPSKKKKVRKWQKISPQPLPLACTAHPPSYSLFPFYNTHCTLKHFHSSPRKTRGRRCCHWELLSRELQTTGPLLSAAQKHLAPSPNSSTLIRCSLGCGSHPPHTPQHWKTEGLILGLKITTLYLAWICLT